jgi:uncharacterized protein YjiS (DUF1127 family)
MHIATNHSLINSHSAAPRSDASGGGLAAWIANAARRWRERATERRELAQMDERALRDARLTRWDVEQQISRPFWRG